jgi:NDP-sugar pyrophosphorylase family protein
MTPKRAVIMAGGAGRRLAPYTFVIPKPIVPIGTTPILEIVLRQLSFYGFRRITIAVGHLSEIVRAVAGDGARFGLQLDYVDESKPLGTIGPLGSIADLPSSFLVMNADILTDLDYGKLWEFHAQQRSVATIATYVKTTQLRLGVIDTDSEDRIRSFEEKPVLHHKVSMGIYVFDNRVLKYIPKDSYFGLDQLIAALLEASENIRSYLFDGKWLDMGTPEDYERAQDEFENNRGIYLPARGADSAVQGRMSGEKET